jgi:hypothetical protein
MLSGLGGLGEAVVEAIVNSTLHIRHCQLILFKIHTRNEEIKL